MGTARELLIVLLLLDRSGSKTLDLAADYLFKLKSPALAGLGDEQQDQTIPSLAEPVVCRILHATGEYESEKLGN